MSGDVQPRKRKDKNKKKKDSEASELLSRKLSTREEEPPVSGVNTLGPDDVQFHVQKESHGTGGNWCAKLVFFSLLAILAGLVGLIILENRGLSDLDTPLSESRYSEILDGWVDEHRESHDDHEILEGLNELDDHDHDNEPFEEENDHGDEDDEEDHDDEHDDENHEDEEDHGEDDDDHEVEADDDNNDEEDNDEDNTAENDDDNDEDDEPNVRNKRSVQEDDDDNDDEEDDTKDVEEDDNNTQEDDDNDQEVVEDNNDDDDDEEENNTQEQENDNTQEDDDDNDNKPFEEQKIPGLSIKTDSKVYIKEINSVEELQSQVQEMKRLFNELADSLNETRLDDYVEEKEISKRSVDKIDDDEDDDEEDQENSIEDVVDNDDGEDEHIKRMAQEETQEDNSEDNEEESETGPGSASLGIKIFVGLGLVVVAHQVLLKKTPKNDSDGGNEERKMSKDVLGDQAFETLEIKRRLTIVDPKDMGLVEDEDIGYEDELVYDDEEEDDLYERYSDEEDLEEGQEYPDIVPEEEAPQKPIDDFEEFNRLYKPKFEEKLSVIQPKTTVISTSNPTVTTIQSKGPTSAITITASKTPSPKLQEEEIKPVVQPVQETSPAAVLPDEIPEDHYPDEEEYDYEDEYSDEALEEEDEEEISDVDDSELMKRLEAKYGKIPQTEENLSDNEDEEDQSWTKLPPQRGGGPQDYHEEGDFEEELRRAEEQLHDHPESALIVCDKILTAKPNDIRAIYLRAKALDQLSDLKQDNKLLVESISAYETILTSGTDLEDDVFKEVAERCLERMRFIGDFVRAIPIHKLLIDKFSNSPKYQNELGITYLLLNRFDDAKYVFHSVLLQWRYSGVALVHYGYILAQKEGNYEEAVIHLEEGIRTEDEGTKDGRFFSTWGDALLRLGQENLAREVFRNGSSLNLFRSEYQRSLYNVNDLEAKPFWTVKETGVKMNLETVQANWNKIREEGLSLLNEDGYFADESEQLLHLGEWKQLLLFARGKKIAKNCEKTPFTCKLIEMFPAARFCSRGQVKFSVLHPGTHVWPHCGPTNCRLRAHLGLKVPKDTSIRVGKETQSWSEGEWLIFDDSFEHEVWHRGLGIRLVLIVDIWHPDLNEYQRKHLPPI